MSKIKQNEILKVKCLECLCENNIEYPITQLMRRIQTLEKEIDDVKFSLSLEKEWHNETRIRLQSQSSYSKTYDNICLSNDDLKYTVTQLINRVLLEIKNKEDASEQRYKEENNHE